MKKNENLPENNIANIRENHPRGEAMVEKIHTIQNDGKHRSEHDDNG